MANLVVLHLDKDTGQIVAKDTIGSGGSDLPAGCFEMCGYAFVQNVPSDIWMVEHNTGLTKGVVQIYDNVNEQVFADNVMFVDANNILITFSTPLTGRAYIGLIDDL